MNVENATISSPLQEHATTQRHIFHQFNVSDLLVPQNVINISLDGDQENTTSVISTESATVKTDTIVGFFFLSLSALLFLTICVLCIYVQKPCKRLVRTYRHSQRKRILQAMGVDEIHDLPYDAGFIPKRDLERPNAQPRKSRLVSQHFDAFIDLDPEDVPLGEQLRQQHTATISARLSLKSRLRDRLSQGGEYIYGRDSNDLPGGSLPIIDHDSPEGSLPTRGSGETATMTTDTFNEPLHHQKKWSRTSDAKPASKSLKSSSSSSGSGDPDVVSMTSATMGVESVSRKTPRTRALQDMVAQKRARSVTVKSAAAARFSNTLKPQEAGGPSRPSRSLGDEGNRQRSRTGPSETQRLSLLEESLVSPDSVVVGRFRVRSTVGNVDTHVPSATRKKPDSSDSQ